MIRRNARAGFTLIELTVALVAGLIVALGIVGLSREATRTFHDEMRSSAAEATLRTAVDRLRADLQRAAYMSTANISQDPLIARSPLDLNNVANVNPAMLGILRLAGVHLLAGASAANTPLSAIQPTPLSPDAIELGANMTSAEQFEIQTITQNPPCANLVLSASSPALYRINAVGGGPQAVKELNNVFQPYAGKQFIVRILDDTGRSQYLPTCAGGATGFIGTTPFVAVDISGGAILTPQVTKSLGGVTSTPGGRAWVNPVQIVRWEIINTANEPTQYLKALANQSLLATPTPDPTKYDLVRWYVDAVGTPIKNSMEVIAEYAVDLEFAFSVESATAATWPSTPAMLTFAFDDANNQTWADNVSTVAATKPQRIRVVRARVSTRAAQPDRTLNIPVIPTYGQAFLYRYCINPLGCTTAGALEWARARTLTTEVSLPNQAGTF
jgi:prepilin-type N-terminal cleavage/methylation domain-containing protein